MDIKICGLTDTAALDAALDADADMVGFVFFPPSPRNIDIADAAPLIERACGRALTVALTVDADDDLLDVIASGANPDWIQLHGRETPARVSEIREKFGRPVMNVVGVSTAEDVAVAATYDNIADRILFDAKAPREATRPGGLGQTFDWSLLAGAAYPGSYMLSGGLDADTVAKAIAAVNPGGIDVSSGVEKAPGIKDEEKIRLFIARARAASAKNARLRA